MASRNAATARKRQSSVVFAKGTKPNDAPGNQSSRDSKAWAGMLMADGSDDDDSDSDASDNGRANQSRIPPASSSSSNQSLSQQSQNGGPRNSWTSRAAAVGSRPPDTASQNPPTLKLLGLKSVKDGGAPLGGNGEYSKPMLSPALTMRHQVERRQQEEQQRREQQLRVEQQRNAARNRTPSPAFDMMDDGANSNQSRDRQPPSSQPASTDQGMLRVQSTSDYGGDAGRHGSMIAFGEGSDGFGGAAPAAKPQQAGPTSRGYELHDGPVPRPAQQEQPPMQRQPPMNASLAPPSDPHGKQPMSPRTALTHQLGLGERTPSPISPMGGPGPDSANANGSGLPLRELVLAGGPPSPQARARMGPFSPDGPGPIGQQQRNGPVPASLQSGMPINRGPPTPNPIPLPSPVHMPPNMQRGPSPMQPPPGPSPMGSRSGFSESPAPNAAPLRRPSLFRRSKAFLMGGNVNGPMMPQGGPRQPALPQQQGQGQRQSIFRKSVALFTGRGGPPQGQQQLPNDDDDDDDSNAPAPRVQGFVDEKPRERKSMYLGGGGMGDEWDYTGSGSRFWKRFSLAQHKLQDGEFNDMEKVRKKVARRQKITLWSSLIGGLIIIAAVVAVVIWRENVKTSDVPGAVNRQQNGAGEDLDQKMSAGTSGANTNQQQTKDAASSATATASTAASTDSTATANGTGDDEDTGTTKKKSKKKKKKSKKTGDNDERRRRDMTDLSDTFDNSAALVRRQVESAFPLEARTMPLLERDPHTMTRRRRHHHTAMAHAES